MEFKQPSRYGRVQPRPITPPARSTPAPVRAQPTPPPPASPPVTPPASTPAAKPFFTKKRIIIASATLLAIIAIIITAAVIGANSANNKKAAIIEDTGYTTILPEGASIKQLGGWERISPVGTDAVYAYADKIGDIVISVSEQPLPATFTASPEQALAELAKGYSATNKIDADGTTVYIGTSAKGPQSTLFIKKNLLVLIKSQKKIEDKEWIRYINSLS